VKERIIAKMGKSRVLVLGATGYIGKYIAKASAQLGHPTFVLVRPATLDSSKKELLDSFTAAGITILHGDIGDKESIVAALKQVDVVISALGMSQLLDQLNLIKAIKEVGHIKRFLPSEFGTDVERVTKIKAIQSVFRPKVEIRNAIREAGIPYTFVNSNGFIAYAASLFFKENLQVPPSDKVTIFGDGNVKVSFVAEDDVALATIKAIDDPRTLNKQLVIRPKTNILSLNELVELLEKKIGHNLEKNYIPKSVIQAQLDELPYPDVILPAFAFSSFVKGDTVFELGPEDVQATELYPDLEFTTFSSVLDTMV
jgi:uncharacterized protein YbjT (DUF2867 family)